MRRWFFFLLAERDGATVCLHPEEQKRQPDQQHAEGKEQKGGEHRRLRRLGRDDVAGAGDQREAKRPEDLADAICRLAETGGTCAHAHP